MWRLARRRRSCGATARQLLNCAAGALAACPPRVMGYESLVLSHGLYDLYSIYYKYFQHLHAQTPVRRAFRSEMDRGAQRAGPGAWPRRLQFFGQARFQVPEERVARARRKSGSGIPAGARAPLENQPHPADSHAGGRHGTRRSGADPGSGRDGNPASLFIYTD